MDRPGLLLPSLLAAPLRGEMFLPGECGVGDTQNPGIQNLLRSTALRVSGPLAARLSLAPLLAVGGGTRVCRIDWPDRVPLLLSLSPAWRPARL